MTFGHGIDTGVASRGRGRSSSGGRTLEDPRPGVSRRFDWSGALLSGYPTRRTALPGARWET
ncbi:hypothetical protein [Streptomyces resistomycificus]|uniref:hypothetical protein n=1 Tax=Streptomyces resistomycificus TaxID=67356 RepID=UPI000AB14E50|nr:hypothetical protein [Streptomyces resistomycificus]